MLKETEAIDRAISKLKEYLETIPGLSIQEITTQKTEGNPDICIRVNTYGENQVLQVEVKTQGNPKSTRNAVNALLRYQEKDPSLYSIFVAPYISPKSAEICTDAGIGYMDLSGNCLLSFKQIYIYRENYPNQFTVKTRLRSLYYPKSERILRVLLTFPGKTWKTLELANTAQVSPGMITHVKKILDDEEWIKSTQDGFILEKPKDLLDDWAKHYSIQKNEVHNYYSLKPPSDVESDLAEYCQQQNLTYALTGFSASNRLAPMVRNQRLMAYVDTDIPQLSNKLDLKPVTSGANVVLLKPYDPGVLWNSQQIDGILVANPIQVYLDLINLQGRGEEAAKFLYKEVIQRQWQLQKSTTMTSL